jgi:hypothetical protein
MVLCLGWTQDPNRGNGSYLGSMFNITLPGSLSIVISQDHYGDHYPKEITTPVMMLWKYRPLNQDDAL